MIDRSLMEIVSHGSQLLLILMRPTRRLDVVQFEPRALLVRFLQPSLGMLLPALPTITRFTRDPYHLPEVGRL